MKKVMLLGLGAAAMSVSTLALASDWNELNPHFYLGGELQATKSEVAGKYKGFSNTNLPHLEGANLVPMHRSSGGFGAGAGFFVGVQLNDYAAVEAGYTHYTHGNRSYETKNSHPTNGSIAKLSVSQKVSNMYGDVLGFVPMTEKCKLIAAVGVGYLNAKTSADITFEAADVGNNATVNAAKDLVAEISDDSKKKFGIRLGLGAQYSLNQNWNVRGMFRYQKGNKMIKNMKSFGLGLSYAFV